MAQHVFPPGSSYSNASSEPSSNGSWQMISSSHDQRGGQGYVGPGYFEGGGGGREGGAPPPIPPREPTYPRSYQHLGPDVKLPPSLHPQPHPRSISSFSPGVSEGVVSAQSTSGSMMVHVPPGYVTEPPAVIPMSDIVKQLDFAANENLRLRHRLEENNHILDQKLRDIQKCLEDKEKTIKDLERQASEATNKFFEARVAVMGYKCRNMQLQGELEAKGGQDVMAEVAELRQQKHLLEEQLRRGGVAMVGGGGGSVSSLQIQLERLQLEKRTLEGERDNLAGVVSGLRRDMQGQDQQLQQEFQRVLRAKEELGRRVEELQRDNMAAREQAMQQQSLLQNEVDRLHDELARSQQQSLQSHHSKSRELEAYQGEALQLRGEVYRVQQQLSQGEQYRTAIEEKLRVSEEDRATVKEELRIVHGYKAQLEGKIAELNQEKELLTRKVEEIKSKGSPPIPKPRTNVQPQVERLENEKRVLEGEKKRLEEELREARRDGDIRQKAEALLQDTRTKAQQLGQENASLKQELEEKKRRIATASEENSQAEGRIAQLRSELAKAQTSIELGDRDRSSELEQERRQWTSEKSELAAKCANLERDLEREKAKGAVAVEESGPQKRKKPLEKRLNDAVGENRRLTEENASLREQLQAKDEVQEAVSRMQAEIDELRSEQQTLVQEKHEAELKVDGYRRDLVDQKDRYDRSIAELSQTTTELSSKSASLEDDLLQASSELALKDDRIGELSRELERLRENQIEKGEQERHQLEQSLRVKDAELQDSRQNFSRLQGQVQGLEGDKEQAQVVLNTYKKECESLMEDYQSCADQLHGTTEERDRLKHQVDVGLRELAKRADKITQLEKANKELDRQRGLATDRIEHMDFQLKTYMDDFERERRAREDHAESIRILEDRKKELEVENRNFKGQLTHYAAQNMRQEQEDEDWQEQQLATSGRHSPFNPPGRASDPSLGVPQPPSQEHHFPGPGYTPGADQYNPRRPKSGEQQLYREAGAPHGHGLGRQPGAMMHINDRVSSTPDVTGVVSGGRQSQVWTVQNPARPEPPRRQIATGSHGNVTGPGYGRAAAYEQPLAFQHVPLPGPHTALPRQGPPGGMAAHPPPSQPKVAGIGGLRNEFGPTGHIPGPHPPAAPANRSMWDPGEGSSHEPPKMACPICQRSDFETQGDLERHSALCTGP